VLDAKLIPIDFTSEAEVEAATGKPVILCAPVRSPLEGHVRDASAAEPIANATVVVESWQAPAPIGGPQLERRLLISDSVTTDASGYWFVAGASQWAPGILAADGLPFFVTSYCVDAPGYARFLYDPWKTSSGHFETPPAEALLTSANAQTPLHAGPRVSSCGIPLDPSF